MHDYMLMMDPDTAEIFGSQLRGLAVKFKGFNQPSCIAADDLKTHGWLAGGPMGYEWART